MNQNSIISMVNCFGYLNLFSFNAKACMPNCQTNPSAIDQKYFIDIKRILYD